MNREHNQVHHLTTEHLLDYLDKRLTTAESTKVEEHLATDCQTCQAELDWLQETLNLMASNVWLDPPAHLRTSARRLFRNQQQKKPAFALGEWLSSLWVQPRPLFVGAAAMLIIAVIGGVLLLSGPSSSQSAEIASIQGEAVVQPADSDVWVPASSEESLQDGSTVRTGDDSTVVLSFPDDSKVLIAPDTELSIVRMNAVANGSTRVIVLRQTSGSTHNIVQETSSAASRYEVQTPSATVIVQGTEFTVEVDDKGSTYVLVNEGTVSVAAQGVTIEVDAGQATTVNVGNPPSVVEKSPTIPAPAKLTERDATQSNNSIDPPAGDSKATATPSPTVRPEDTATPSSTPKSSSTPTPSSTPTSTATPTASSTPTSSATPTSTPASTSAPPGSTPGPGETPQPTSTPSSPTPLPTDSEVTPPTPQPTETPKKTKKPPDPPGQTNTPEPPGHTRNPSTSNANGAF